MCVSRLHQVLELGPDGSCVVADLDGRRRRVSLLAYEDRPLRSGDWIVVHSGYALAAVRPEEVEAVLAMVSLGDGDRETGR
jgi:hydrogenase maturation factor